MRDMTGAQIDLLGAPDVGGPRDELDRYYTPPWCTRALLHYLGERLEGVIWEPCAGQGHIVDELKAAERSVYASDIFPQKPNQFRQDFLEASVLGYPEPIVRRGVLQRIDYNRPRWILTNPPYRTKGDRTAASFVHHALPIARDAIAMLLRLSMLEPAEDREQLMITNSPTDLVVLPRVSFIGAPKGGESITSAWFVWDKRKTTQHIHVYPQEIRSATYDWSRAPEPRWRRA